MTTLDPAARPQPSNAAEHPAHRPIWRKSQGSMPSNDCVETARLDPAGHTIGIRDSKNVPGPMIAITARHWRDLTDQIKRGHHDLL